MALQATFPLVIMGAAMYARLYLFQQRFPQTETELTKYKDGTSSTVRRSVPGGPPSEAYAERKEAVEPKNKIDVEFKLSDAFFVETQMGGYAVAHWQDLVSDSLPGYYPSLIKDEDPQTRAIHNIYMESFRREREMRGLPPLRPETPVEFDMRAARLKYTAFEGHPYWSMRYQQVYPHLLKRYQDEYKEWNIRRLRRIVDTTYDGGIDAFESRMRSEGKDSSDVSSLEDSLSAYRQSLINRYLPKAKASYQEEIREKGISEPSDSDSVNIQRMGILRIFEKTENRMFLQSFKETLPFLDEIEETVYKKKKEFDAQPFKLKNYTWYRVNGLPTPNSTLWKKLMDYKAHPERLVQPNVRMKLHTGREW